MVARIRLNPERCCYCGGCIGVCPKLALELDDVRLVLYEGKCINCMACVRLCPVGAITEIKENSASSNKAIAGAMK